MFYVLCLPQPFPALPGALSLSGLCHGLGRTKLGPCSTTVWWLKAHWCSQGVGVPFMFYPRYCLVSLWHNVGGP